MNSWMVAHQSKEDALSIAEMILTAENMTPNLRFLKSTWQRDQTLLKAATPFAWDAGCVQAVLEAARTVPDETPLAVWNLPERITWWHFERPLPFQTITESSGNEPIRALNLGWFGDVFVVNAWIVDSDHRNSFGIAPSQIFNWRRGETLAEMLTRASVEYAKLYGPGGRYADTNHVGIDIFLLAAKQITQFVLAGIAWMSQKLLTQAEGPIERHLRKAYERKHGSKPPAVRVVQLRRTEHAHHEGEGYGGTREFTCRWMVGGHWRNQVCGPQRSDRKLTYISPYLKGPDDKPFRAAPQKVYEVRR